MYLQKIIKPLLAVICAWLASAAIAAPLPAMPDGWSEGYVYANGIRIHYYHAVPRPGKPVIVMVHGVTDIGLSWTTLSKDLQNSFDIYMPDSRGHGLSDPFTDGDNDETLIKDVVGFVHGMHFTKPILLGHSMGAAQVMRVGAEFPDLPRAVIMFDPLLGPLPKWFGPPPPRPPGAAGPSMPPSNRGAVTMFGAPAELIAQNNQSFDELLAACGKQNTKWDPVDCQYWALSKKQYHGPYSAAQALAMSGTMALGDSLARIAVPSLILKADAPPETRTTNLKAASVMKHGKLIHVDAAGHNLHHDQRARTVELLTGFLSKL